MDKAARLGRSASFGAVLIQRAREQDVTALVALHRTALDYSLNSRLGSEHLARIYRLTINDSQTMVAKAELQGQTVGVVSATLDPERLTARMRTSLNGLDWARLLVTLGLRPALWPLVLESLAVSRPITWKGVAIRPCLTAIAVSALARHQGVGRGLVAAVDDFVRLRGQAMYRLDTLSSNQGALEFYRRLGFVEAERRGRAVILVKLV